MLAPFLPLFEACPTADAYIYWEFRQMFESLFQL